MAGKANGQLMTIPALQTMASPAHGHPSPARGHHSP